MGMKKELTEEVLAKAEHQRHQGCAELTYIHHAAAGIKEEIDGVLKGVPAGPTTRDKAGDAMASSATAASPKTESRNGKVTLDRIGDEQHLHESQKIIGINFIVKIWSRISW